jgi:hypothetical protein
LAGHSVESLMTFGRLSQLAYIKHKAMPAIKPVYFEKWRASKIRAGAVKPMMC